jgi:hypothetical protein
MLINRAIERFHETLKQRTKTMRGLKNIESAYEFLQGWLVHYNYLRPHLLLGDETTAEVVGIDYPYKNWAGIIRHEPSEPVIIGHKPRCSLRLEPSGIRQKRKRIRIRKPRQGYHGPPPPTMLSRLR